MTTRSVSLRGPGRHDQPTPVPVRLRRRKAEDLFGAEVEELLERRAELPPGEPALALRHEPAIGRGPDQRLPAGRLLDVETAHHVDECGGGRGSPRRTHVV